jgi:hypothetical protein
LAMPKTLRRFEPYSGFLLFVLFLLLVTAVTELHFDLLAQSAVAAVAITALTRAGRFLPEKLGKRFVQSWQKFLQTRRASWVFLTLCGLVLGASALMTSVHVDIAEGPDPPVMLYSVEESDGPPPKVRILDSMRLDAKNKHRNFLMRSRFAGTRVWVVSSEYRRTKDHPRTAWTSPRLLYPADFRPVVAARLLPAPDILASITKQNTAVRVLVTDAKGTTIAEDSLTETLSMPGIVLSFVRPPPISTETRAVWLQLLQTALGSDGDADEMGVAVDDWMKSRWLQPSRDLREGEKLAIKFVKRSGDAVASADVTLTSSVSDVFIKRGS